jgi:hypothetical protein
MDTEVGLNFLSVLVKISYDYLLNQFRSQTRRVYSLHCSVNSKNVQEASERPYMFESGTEEFGNGLVCSLQRLIIRKKKV